MPLPSLEKIIPQFDITIPSTEAVVKFRPFLVKEEKLLLIALEGNDESAMLDGIIQVVTSCALQPIKIDALSNFDLEYIFLQLRARSVDEWVELAYKCHNEITLSPEQVQRRFRGRELAEGEIVTASCDNVVKIRINLDTIEIHRNPEHSTQVMLTDTLGVNMRYPNCKMAKMMLAKSATSAKQSISDAFQTIAMCVESVFDSESVFTNFTPKEIQDWIEKLTQHQFSKLQAFFDTIPKLAHDVDFLCPECGYKETIHVEGLASFFG